MTTRNRWRPVLALTAALLALASGAHLVSADGIPCEFSGVERVVAIGDVHGAYDRFLSILRTAGVVDDRDRWAGGRTHLVQTGDVLDRGPDSLKVVDLLERLGTEATRAGGRVHFLLGNHEAMRMLGDLRYVVPGEYQAFTTDGSRTARQRAIMAAPPKLREQMQKTPLGMVEMARAFGPKAPYGRLLRSLNAVVRINGVVFLHGGISPAVASLSCSAINDRVRRDLTEDFDRTKAAPLDSLTAREDGPLWYRGLAQESDDFGPNVDRILTAQGARAIVTGHTVVPNGRVLARFGGKVVMIDTGMQPAYVPTGRASALEIRDDSFTAIYEDGREVLPATALAPLSQAR